MSDPHQEAIQCTVLLGPTAVGKSNLMYSEFSELSLHVISADSMQIYRHFDVATATPPETDRNKFPHTGINEINPDDDFSVSEFLEMADRACKEAVENDRHPVVVGGTALYIQSFLYGLDDMPDKNPEYRRQLRREAEEKESDYLHQRLQSIDPDAAEKIHPNDKRRIIRALEIYHETGKTKTELTSTDEIRSQYEPTVLGLTRSREELDDRIESRVEQMLENGLIEEIRALKQDWDVSKTLKQAIGFQSVSDYLDGKISYSEIGELMVDRTRNLVRKQESWFKKLPVTEWFHPDHDNEELIDTVGNQFD